MKKKNSNIYINGRFLAHKTDGISRFSFEICKALKQLNFNFTLIVPNWLDFENIQNFDIIRFGDLKSHLWEQINLPIFLRKNGSPLLINLSGLGPLYYKNQIVTIHDVSFYVNAKWFSWTYRLIYAFATPIVAKSAKTIITVSEFSKSEIIKYLRLPSFKVQVIYNAVSKDLMKLGSTSQPPYQQEYVLAVASLDPRKNLQRLVDAFSNSKLKDVTLVLVGKSASHFNFKINNESQNVSFAGHVNDEQLASLYRNCSLFVYPSLYEGFGIPPLEAMSFKVPVLAADIPSLREVCGQAVNYFDPYDIEDMATKIVATFVNRTERQRLIMEGDTQVKKYDWIESANKLKHIIERTIN